MKTRRQLPHLPHPRMNVIRQLQPGVVPAGTPYPQVVGTATTPVATYTTSSSINLPSSIASGDLLVILVRTGGASTTHNTPTNWNLQSSFSSNGRSSIFWRYADGTEGSTVSFTTVLSRKLAAIALRITGAVNAAPENVAWNSTPALDPSLLTPSGGSDDYLWLAVGTDRKTNNVVSAAPSNYSSLLTVTSQDAYDDINDAYVALAQRALTASSENAGAFTAGGTNNPHSTLLAIKPA